MQNRLPSAVLALPLMTMFAFADVEAAAVNYVDVVRQGIGGASGITGATAIAVAPDGVRAYVAAPADSAITVFDRTGSDGSLAFRQTLVDVSKGGTVDGLSGVAGIAVDPSGQHVYAVSLNGQALAVFGLDTQGLSPVETYRNGAQAIDGLIAPFKVAVSPDGAHVYVATRDTTAPDAVLAFGVVDTSGRLAFIGRYDGIDDAVALAISADGAHLYVADGQGVALYARDHDSGSPGYGTLTLVERYASGPQGIADLDGASAIAIDPYGVNVYVSGSLANAVVAFARDAATGRLTAPATYVNGTGGINGLEGPLDMVITPDGARLCIAGAIANALVVLARDTLNGQLSYLETHRQGDGGFVDGLDHVIGLAVSADGASLYTASPLQAKVGVFSVAAADIPPPFLAASFSVKTRPGVAIDIDALARNSTPSGVTLTLSAFDTRSARGATLTRNDNGSLHYQPPSGFHGADTFGYTLSDGHQTGSATVTIIVNTPPDARAASATTTANIPVVILVLGNDSDADGDILELAAMDAVTAAGGTATNNGDNAVRYTPPHDFVGTDHFTYTVSDGLDTATAVVTVTVRHQGSGVAAEPPGSDSGSSGGHGGGAIDKAFVLASGLVAALRRWQRRHNKRVRP